MKRAILLLVVALVAGCANGSGPAATPQPLPTATPGQGAPLSLEPFLDGFEQPVLLTHDDGGTLYVVEQAGRIWRLAGDERELWLDLRADVQAGGERGLLGLAFEPDSAIAYLDYTDRQGDSILERIRDDRSREPLLKVEQPYPNHNGGGLAFGPDGMLYYGLGDGGSGGDPQGNGQDPSALLGSLLRIDPAHGTHAIYAKGLRNPWRFSFDRATGDLYIGDVGQNKYEEIDHLATSAPAGANFGWNVYEGTHRYSLTGQPFSPHTPPVAEYAHDGGHCSVTGGYVYRGSASPSLAGVYLFGDYCSGTIWGMKEKEGTWRVVELLDTELSISSFGEDAEGEIYVVDHGGAILRLVGGALPDPLRGP